MRPIGTEHLELEISQCYSAGITFYEFEKCLPLLNEQNVSVRKYRVTFRVSSPVLKGKGWQTKIRKIHIYCLNGVSCLQSACLEDPDYCMELLRINIILTQPCRLCLSVCLEERWGNSVLYRSVPVVCWGQSVQMSLAWDTILRYTVNIAMVGIHGNFWLCLFK